MDLYNCDGEDNREDFWIFLVAGLIVAVTGFIIQVCVCFEDYYNYIEGLIVIFFLKIIFAALYVLITKRKPVIKGSHIPLQDRVLGFPEFMQLVDNLYSETKKPSHIRDDEEPDHRSHIEQTLNQLSFSMDPESVGQFRTVAKALNNYEGDGEFSEAKVRLQVFQWIKNNRNFEIRKEDGSVTTLYHIIGTKKWESYLQSFHHGQGDYLTLLAIVQLYKIDIDLYTSLKGGGYTVHLSPLVIDDPVVHQSRSISEPGLSKMGILSEQSLDEFSSLDHGDDDFDVKSIRSSSSKKRYNDNNLLDDDDDEHPELTEKVEQKIVIKMYHYYLKEYGGITDSSTSVIDGPIYNEGDFELRADLEHPSMMSPYEPEMRMCIKSGSSFLNAIALTVTILTGFWWLLWLPIWGQDYTNFWSICGFLIFYVSELINFFLGLVYQVNFLFPVSRRWKCLRMLPNFTIVPRADCMIFHYTESVDTTTDTLRSCLEIEKSWSKVKVKSDVYICDDGFWQSVKSQSQNTASKSSIIEDVKDLFSYDDVKTLLHCNDCLATCCKRNSNYSLISDKAHPTRAKDEIERKKPIREEVALASIKEDYNIVPTELGRNLIKKIMVTLKKHYGEQQENPDDVIVKYSVSLTKLVENGGGKDGFGAVSRRDCAIGSLCYQFRVSLPSDAEDTQSFRERPSVFLVARIKPKKHHYKAGNINNCLYNEMSHDDNRFVCFFDNDMQPQTPFLSRTLPFFFTYNEATGRYYYNKRVSFVQTPQHFTEVTTGKNFDHLASKNSIFFQAIQKGRDGFKSCAFAGTNAVFRVGALYGIGGMPYGSVTEDALAGRYLHKAGYRSIYAEQILAIGEAPTTVASAMKQRMRWCKVKYY